MSNNSENDGLAKAENFALSSSNTSEPPCEKCREELEPINQYIYALGTIDVKFPTLGIEREFQQRSRAAGKAYRTKAMLREVLSANPHLARAVSYIFSIGGLPAYVVNPMRLDVLTSVVNSIDDEAANWNLIIGHRKNLAPITISTGFTLPIVDCHQVYSFTIDEHASSLKKLAEPALKTGRLKEEGAVDVFKDLFRHLAISPENLGNLDHHRALNYALVQHPGLYLAALERAERATLDTIETRWSQSTGGRTLITLIFIFVDQSTGVSERLSTRVDVTEQWPFIVGGTNGAAAPLGLSTYIEQVAHEVLP